MKKILITGAGSYIGTSFENYIKENYPDDFTVDTVDMLGDGWKEKDFSGYDSVFHVAGIAHSDNGKISEEKAKLYYAVNTDLTVATAKKAKAEGVGQFIFMSSAIVYGESAPIGKHKLITKDTPVSPANCYGDSKVQAEKGINELADDKFKVVSLRPPMIYGKGSRGNYPLLKKIALKLPIFPYVDNQRSMLYIENLCEFIRLMVVNNEQGVFFPQNTEYSNTSELVGMIASAHGKKIRLIKGFGWALKFLSHITGLVNKAFGNLVYDKGMSEYHTPYATVGLEESIKRTEAEDCENRVLMLASVASMIDLFNEDNIDILQKLGCKIHVMTNFEFGSITSDERVAQFKNELIDKGIQATHVPIPRTLTKIKLMVESYRMIKKEVEKNRYRIVHCHSPIGGVVCRLACRKARKRGTKVIYTAHGFHFFDGASKKNWLMFYPVEKLCARYTDVLITINKEDYNRASGWKKLRVEYVPGIGVHTKKFARSERSREEMRDSVGLDKNDFVLMSTGQISVRKNQEVVIRALAKAGADSVKYLIVGTGELEQKLKSLAKELGIEKQVVFAGYRKDIGDLLHAVDAFIFPSLQEGLPVALMESMAAGLPIICSKIRGNTDLITDGEGGYIVDPRDEDGFAAAIDKLVENYESLDTMRNINVKAMQNFDVSKVRVKMTELYKQLL